MPQPSFPDRPPGQIEREGRGAGASAVPRWLVPGLGLGVLVTIDLWLAARLVRSLGAVVAELSIPLLPLAAALGCAIMAGTALLATRLLLADFLRALRGEIS